MTRRLLALSCGVLAEMGGACLMAEHFHDDPQKNPLGYVGLVLFVSGALGMLVLMLRRAR